MTVSTLILLTACNDGDSPKKQTADRPAPTASAPPSTGAPTTGSSTSPASGTSTPAAAGSQAPSATTDARAPQGASPEAAIRRFEEFLHGLGREDIATLCEIAGPAAKQAENEGAGPCATSFTGMFRMMSATGKKALTTATVDPALVSVRGTDRVDIPARAIRATTTFTSGDLGDSTLRFIDNAWYVVD
ncbi:hypothetical protein ACFRCG_01845 [Embleya sp. NPDC056575]|uniref:hypothetical protein n=1 Tax=unclassified Embleya TaxID=2699296 RepID=UPI00369E3A4D